jgi:hypothetical protein
MLYTKCIKVYTRKPRPASTPLSERPELEREYQEWDGSRREFLNAVDQRDTDAVQAGWPRHYTRGITPGGAAAGAH